MAKKIKQSLWRILEHMLKLYSMKKCKISGEIIYYTPPKANPIFDYTVTPQIQNAAFKSGAIYSMSSKHTHTTSNDNNNINKIYLIGANRDGFMDTITAPSITLSSAPSIASSIASSIAPSIAPSIAFDGYNIALVMAESISD